MVHCQLTGDNLLWWLLTSLYMSKSGHWLCRPFCVLVFLHHGRMWCVQAMLFTAIFYVFPETALLGRNWELPPHLKFNLNFRYFHVHGMWWWCFASVSVMGSWRFTQERQGTGWQKTHVASPDKALLGHGTGALEGSMVSQLLAGGQRQLSSDCACVTDSLGQMW